MNIWDLLIVALLAAVVVFAAVRIVKRKKRGKGCCGCDCASCGGCAAMKQGIPLTKGNATRKTAVQKRRPPRR